MPPMLARLLLDAQDEVARATEHIPAPGRERRLGRLNQPGWSIAHLSTSHDGWLNAYGRGLPHDPWCAGWYERQSAAGWDRPLPVALDDARDGYRNVLERTTPFLEHATEEDLAHRVSMEGTRWPPTTLGYLMARAVAHAFAHAGELTVAASLVGAGDLGLPGELARTRDEQAEREQPLGLRLVLALAQDARSEVARVAAGLPRPAQVPLFAPRLNSGAAIVAHVARSQDVAWNEMGQQLERDAWLEGLRLDAVEPGDPGPAIDFDAALEAYRRVCQRSDAYLASLPQRERVARQAVFGLAWTAAHLFAHAGELTAIGSLVGMPDQGLPGRLTACAEVANG